MGSISCPRPSRFLTVIAPDHDCGSSVEGQIRFSPVGMRDPRSDPPPDDGHRGPVHGAIPEKGIPGIHSPSLPGCALLCTIAIGCIPASIARIEDRDFIQQILPSRSGV